ncbi:hypothetical protein GOHSU_31_00270 [Gordonia hirsuta DSM 44140 = NBRC 16056]|uniref:Uncharacterized protein n=1 Tax=Gordonia hirsuta DSM 44140 = NBRC 16056 TaxID=1121927 RepID=L7LBP3_9ACTN|nr:hypothetical protein GOHSU_31_00270 [Gordonia hirsuta DSM 44140 = NBRC 16056]
MALPPQPLVAGYHARYDGHALYVEAPDGSTSMHEISPGRPVSWKHRGVRYTLSIEQQFVDEQLRERYRQHPGMTGASPYGAEFRLTVTPSLLAPWGYFRARSRQIYLQG